MPRRGAEAKATKKSGSQQVGGESKPHTEGKRGLGPGPKASLLPNPDGSPREVRASQGVQTTPATAPRATSLSFMHQGLEGQTDAWGLATHHQNSL